jgi:hypothetical protein
MASEAGADDGLPRGMRPKAVLRPQPRLRTATLTPTLSHGEREESIDTHLVFRRRMEAVRH